MRATISACEPSLSLLCGCTPTKFTRCPSAMCTAWKSGISRLQTPHQEAEKFSTVGLPASAALLSVPPENFGSDTLSCRVEASYRAWNC